MGIAHTVSADATLGLRPDYSIDLLKSQLGVERLELVVLTSVDEYSELLIEKESPRWSWCKRIAVTLVALVIYMVVAGVFHPGARIDHLIKPWDYLGVH